MKSVFSSLAVVILVFVAIGPALPQEDDLPKHTKKFVKAADEGFAKGFHELFAVKKPARVVQREHNGKKRPHLLWIVTAKDDY